MDLRVLLPSQNCTAGVGPAINRRRAQRAGTDLVRTPARARRVGGNVRVVSRASMPGNKKPATPSVAGLVFGVVLGFRERDAARVHRVMRPGGGLCCAARCLVISTHSLPQVMSAWGET